MEKELINMLKTMQELRIFSSSILRRDIKGSISSMQELDLLSRLKLSKKDLTSIDLSETMELSKPAISRLINRLINKDLIEKVQSKSDKRIFYLYLTDFGNSELDKAYTYYLEPINNLKGKLGSEDFENLIDLINKVNFINGEDL